MNERVTPFEKYVRDGDEEAFRQLVRDYFNLVHGAATRLMNQDPDWALDVAQVVFRDLATKAHSLPKNVLLGGWLHRHTCFVAANALRTERRRVERERIAVELNAMHTGDEDVWKQLAPQLDDAIEDLDEADRAALLLRFFEGRDLRSVGQALCISDDAAQKRVQRAIERLRSAFERRGVSVTSALLVSALLSRLTSPVSAAGIDSIASAALAQSPVSSGLFPLFLASMKSKIAVLLVLLLALSIPFLWNTANRQQGVAPNNLPPTSATMNGSSESTDLQLLGETIPALANLKNSPNPPGTAFTTDTAPDEDVPRIALQVLDSVSRQPIPGVTVRGSELILSTDHAGRLAFPVGDVASRLQLDYSKEGYAGWIDIWEPDRGEPIPLDHTVSLEPAAQMGGIVQNNLGLPVEGVAVRMSRFYSSGDRHDRSNHRLDTGVHTNYTDANGRWTTHRFPDALLEKVHLSFSHPDYASTNKFSSPDLAGLLRAQKLLITLGAGAHLFGRVTDTNGVPIAGAKVTFGGQNSSSQKDTRTDDYGKYEIKNVTIASTFEENAPVTVMADSFAPAIQTIRLEKEVIELNFAMTPGGVIRGRVLNSRHEPIPGVRVSRESPSQVQPQNGISWSELTDSEGRFEWLGAPLGPQSFYFGHRDYLQIRGKRLNPQEEEHLIILNDTRVVKGTVRDAKTGEAIEAFSVTPGQGTRESLSRSSPSQEADFKDGVFEIGLGEEYYNALRIRATGYVSAIYLVSQNIQTELIDARLEPTRALRGKIVDASGKPVVRAQIVAVSGATRSESASLAPGRLSQYDRNPDKTMTDDAGDFVLYPSGMVNWIVAVAEAGFHQLPADALDQQGAITLAPWASVEGTLIENGKPAAAIELLLTSGEDDSGVILDINSFKALTDAKGIFRFEKVPPRPLGIAQLIPNDPPPSRSSTIKPLTNFVVAPGNLTQIQVQAFRPLSPP